MRVAPCFGFGWVFLWHLKPGGMFCFTFLEVGLEKEEKLKGKISRMLMLVVLLSLLLLLLLRLVVVLLLLVVVVLRNPWGAAEN